KNAGHVEARYSMGILYWKTGRKIECQRLVEQWLTEQPRSPEPYALDGWRYRQENDHLQSKGRLQQALGLDPHNVHALTEMGILYETMGMPERAVFLYEQALS